MNDSYQKETINNQFSYKNLSARENGIVLINARQTFGLYIQRLKWTLHIHLQVHSINLEAISEYRFYWFDSS